MTQPSLIRQIRDLEDEVGTPLLVRGAKGVRDELPDIHVVWDLRLSFGLRAASLESSEQSRRPAP
jgi:LysR family hca operon transcriptional activator